uniref:Mannose receptor, C type 1b n=1 Tax=Mola mola TaxID=94237 RepID=A0A3Q3W752_MOLML
MVMYDSPLFIIFSYLNDFILLQVLIIANDPSFFASMSGCTIVRKSAIFCFEFRWITGNRLLVPWFKKCLGAQGKSVGSEIHLYDCDENSDLQKWECKNETLLTLKDQGLYIEVTADSAAVLSKTIGPNNHLKIPGTRSFLFLFGNSEIYTIGGNANGRICMFPFLYNDVWYSTCTSDGTANKRPWCAVETKFDNQLWGYCPTNTREDWNRHPITGAYYQVNTDSALTWSQAETSCKQQGASLLSITDPHQHTYVIGKMTLTLSQGDKLWTGMILDPEHGWQWSNAKPYRYLKWDSGHPLPDPGQNCALLNGAVQYSWQSSTCTKKLGYICYSETTVARPTQGKEKHSNIPLYPWIPYNGHCFYLSRYKKSWTDAQKECRKDGGDLVSIHNVEEQSFVISQLGYAPEDELWIGLNDRKTERLFDWTDHSTVSFTSWELGCPAVFSDQEDCVLIRGENGNWADRVCDEKHGFICMKTSDSKPSGDEVEQNIGCKIGWKRHGSYCYYVGTETKTFDEAKDHCKTSDSYLADVSNGVDNAFLVSLVGLRPEKYFWIGLSNMKHIDSFVWTNTDTVRFTHWNARMPGHQQGCVAMTTGIFSGLWDVLPCTNKTKYICKHLAEGATLTTVAPTAPPPSCADGWTPVPLRHYCSKVTFKMTWYEARDYCRAIGGDLLSIHSAGEMKAIPDNAPDPITGYVWTDGSPVNFQDWQDGEPNNKNNVESCAELRIQRQESRSLWNDVHCETYNNWLCQIRLGENIFIYPFSGMFLDYNKTSDGWLEWNGNQYYINNKVMAMEDARRFCQQRHGDLVTIDSEAESVFLWKQISRSFWSHWIGLTVDLDKTFEWMDGSQAVFQRWDEGQPDFQNFDENCVVMSYSTGFWHDYNCGYEMRSVCKRTGSLPVNTTVAPTATPKGGCPSPWIKFNSKVRGHFHCGHFGIQNDVGLNYILTHALSLLPKQKIYYYTFVIVFDHVTFFSAFSKLSQNCVVVKASTLLGGSKWKRQLCNDTNGYVCLRNVDPSLPDTPESTISTDYVSVVNDSIKAVTQPMTWDAAMEHCEVDGAKLVSLRNKWTKNYAELLALNLKAPVWIGLNKVKTNGYFRFIDGWHMVFSQWGQDEPSQDRPCVYVDMDGKWKTAYCNETMNSVCMKYTGTSQNRESNWFQWIPYKSYCYKFFTKIKEWTDASASCLRHGASLTSIEDPSEQEFIKSHSSVFQDIHSSFWIGLYKNTRGTWLWLDKTVMDYTNWAESQPSAHPVGEISTSNGQWRTNRKQFKRPYICKTPKVTDPRHHGHIALIVVPVIAGIFIVVVMAFFFVKKKGLRVPIPGNLTTFDNPVFVNNEQLKPGMVDTSMLVENAEEDNTEPVSTI